MGNAKATAAHKDVDLIETLADTARTDRFAFVELVGVFAPYLSMLARSFRLPESEYDDLCQVGRIALYRAVCSYDSSRSSFTPFAKVCIKNAMTSLVRSYRAESKLNTDRLSLDEMQASGFSPTADESVSPEELLLAEEFLREAKLIMQNELSASERKVMQCKLNGLGLAEIAVLTGKSVKSVENTLFRARQKLRERLKAKD